jgi:cellulose synthase (UDP-forming)
MSQPDMKALKAAGIVASWFGVLAGSKPIRFSAHLGSVPQGNVVIFQDNSVVSSNQEISNLSGPSVAIKTNPSDPNGSALMIAADNGDQLITAAQALALTKSPASRTSEENSALRSDTWQVTQFKLPGPRDIDDAPRWLPSNKLVPLWNYSSETNTQGDGSKPIPLYFRVPPDLYYGENQNLQLIVDYRYNSRAIADGSALRIFSNGVLINETPLIPGSGFDDRQRKVIQPVIDMRPFGNTLLFNFDFIPKLANRNGQASQEQLQGAILQNSSLDLRGLDRWVQMPNLELFANAGFPFTRWADLSRTIVVLPARPSAQEISLYLHLLSHCGRQTGYPALRVEIAGPNDQVREDRDYLVLGTIANQSTFTALQSSLPVQFDADGVHFKKTDSYSSQIKQLWNRLLSQNKQDELPAVDGDLVDAVIAGIESPYGSGHSLIAVALRDDDSIERFTSTFLARSQSSDISHSVSILKGTKFVSFNLNAADYHIGDISHYTEMRIWLTEYFWALVIAVALSSLILGYWTFEYLNRRAASRLSAGKEISSPQSAGN